MVVANISSIRVLNGNEPLSDKSAGFPGGSNDKESTFNAGDPVSVPRLGRLPDEGNGQPSQESCLENSMDRGAWQTTVQGSQRVRHD